MAFDLYYLFVLQHFKNTFFISTKQTKFRWVDTIRPHYYKVKYPVSVKKYKNIVIQTVEIKDK